MAAKKATVSTTTTPAPVPSRMNEINQIISLSNANAVKHGLTTANKPLFTTLDERTHLLGAPIPTGNPYLDFIFRGGWPRGCWSKHWGVEASGKSAQAMATTGALLNDKENREHYVLWVQAEDGNPTELAKIFGIDPKDPRFILYYCQGSGEQALDGILNFLVSDRVPRDLLDLVVVDSLAALDPVDLMDAATKKNAAGKEKGPEGSTQPGRVAAMYASWFRDLQSLKALGTAHGMMISQARCGLDPYGPKEISVGGKATNHAARLILKYRIEGTIDIEKQQVGHKLDVTLQKDGAFSVLQGQHFHYEAIYGKGFNKPAMYFEMLKQTRGLTEGTKSYWSPCQQILSQLGDRAEEFSKIHGEPAVKKALQNVDFFKAARAWVMDVVNQQGARAITTVDENDQGIEEDVDEPIHDSLQELLDHEATQELVEV